MASLFIRAPKIGDKGIHTYEGHTHIYHHRTIHISNVVKPYVPKKYCMYFFVLPLLYILCTSSKEQNIRTIPHFDVVFLRTV